MTSPIKVRSFLFPFPRKVCLQDIMIETCRHDNVGQEPTENSWCSGFRILKLTACREPITRNLAATPMINQCNGIFTDQSIFRYFPHKIKIGQFQSTRTRFRKNKRMRPHVNKSTSFRQVNVSPCL